MYKKIIIQFLLLIALFGIIISVFFLYFNEEKNQKETNIKTSKIIKSEIDNETGTLIKDINYSFTDSSGNYYELFSEIGIIDIKNVFDEIVVCDSGIYEFVFDEKTKFIKSVKSYNDEDDILCGL
mgnify:CR=1 FL=1